MLSLITNNNKRQKTELECRLEAAERAIEEFQIQAEVTAMAIHTAELLRAEAFKSIKRARKCGLEIRRMGCLEDKLSRKYAEILLYDTNDANSASNNTHDLINNL